MAVDRNLWATSFENTLPHWQCPTCGKGYLASAPEKAWKEETGPSRAARDHDAWEPEWIENRFVCLLECSMPACKEIVAVSGSSGIDHYQIGEDEYQTDEILRVEFMTPAPLPIAFPAQTPEQIELAIRRAAALLWPSAEGAANQVRQAVELLLEDAGIGPQDNAGNFISLHRRIENFRAIDPENGDVLLAAKWPGNSGSHNGGLTRDDAFDAFDMIEFVLENRYGTTKADLMAKVAAVNAAKGPVRQI